MQQIRGARPEEGLGRTTRQRRARPLDRHSWEQKPGFATVVRVKAGVSRGEKWSDVYLNRSSTGPGDMNGRTHKLGEWG